MPSFAAKAANRLVEAYNRGDSIADICNAYSITTYALYEALHKAQLNGNPVRWRYQGVSDEDAAHVVALYNAGVKLNELQERTGMSGRLIYECLKNAERSGLEVRWRSSRVRGGASA